MPDPAEPTAPPPNPAPEVAVPGEAVLGGPIARAGAGIPFGGPADYAAMLQEAHHRYREAQERDAEMGAYNAMVERVRQIATQQAAVAPPPNRLVIPDELYAALGIAAAGAGAGIAPPKDQAAEDRAYALLVGEIGEQAAARVKAGGAFPIPSKLWPGIVYLIPRDGKVRILDRGRVIGESCIVTVEPVPWPDIVLTRIQRIRDDETIVFSIGIVNT